jgi:hypothetical protein
MDRLSRRISVWSRVISVHHKKQSKTKGSKRQRHVTTVCAVQDLNNKVVIVPPAAQHTWKPYVCMYVCMYVHTLCR